MTTYETFNIFRSAIYFNTSYQMLYEVWFLIPPKSLRFGIVNRNFNQNVLRFQRNRPWTGLCGRKHPPIPAQTLDLKSRLRTPPPNTENKATEANIRCKTSPQITGIIEANIQDVIIHSSQTIDLTVYNWVKSQYIIYNANTYS